MKKLIRIIDTVFIATLLTYGLVWGYAYAVTQKACLGYKFELTEVTYDLVGYCAGAYQGGEIVISLSQLTQFENSRLFPPSFGY